MLILGWLRFWLQVVGISPFCLLTMLRIRSVVSLWLVMQLLSTHLLSLFEQQLKPSHLVGISIQEAAALEASVRSQSETLSYSMWILSGLLAFVRLQNFAPEDSSLFNTLVTSLSKSLAHQATLTHPIRRFYR